MLAGGYIEYPSGPDDHEGIKTYATNLIEATKGWRFDLDRGNMQKILYYLGHQWVTYDRSLATWRPIGLRKTTPRPVTNKIAPLVNDTSSRLAQHKAPLTFRPGGMEAEDVVAAGVAEDVLRVVGKECNQRALRPIAARWLSLTGNVYLINSYDNSPESGVQFIQHEQECQGHILPPDVIEDNGGACPECGETAFRAAIDPLTAAPIGQFIPRGRHQTEVKSLFSTLYDPEAESIQDSPYFCLSETVPEDWVVQTYGKDMLEGLDVEESGDTTQFFLQALAYVTSGTGAERVSVAGLRAGRRVKIRRIWIKPRYDKAPHGIYAVILGQDRVAESEEWAYQDDQGKRFLNVVHIQFDGRPGSCIGRTRVDDLIPKQDERNLIESHFLLHTRRMSNAVWLVPTGTGIGKATGETGQFLSYNPVMGAPPPTRVAGVAPPQFLTQWMTIIDQEMDMLWGTYEIGRGEVPDRGGDLAFVSLQLLDERAQQAQATVTENWTVGWMEWANQHLHIWRQYADAERTLAIGGGKWAVKKFNQANLAGGIDMDVDTGTFRPRSHITVRGTLEQLFRWRILNPADPQERFRVLQLLGLPEIMEDYRLDWTQANRENDELVEQSAQIDPMMLQMLMQQGQPQGQLTQGPTGPMGTPGAPMLPPTGLIPPPQPWENHTIHIHIHRQFIMSDKFKELPPPVQQMMLMHMMLHYQMATAMMQPQRQPGQSSQTSEESASSKESQKAAQPGSDIPGEPTSE